MLGLKREVGPPQPLLPRNTRLRRAAVPQSHLSHPTAPNTRSPPPGEAAHPTGAVHSEAFSSPRARGPWDGRGGPSASAGQWR